MFKEQVVERLDALEKRMEDIKALTHKKVRIGEVEIQITSATELMMLMGAIITLIDAPPNERASVTVGGVTLTFGTGDMSAIGQQLNAA